MAMAARPGMRIRSSAVAECGCRGKGGVLRAPVSEGVILQS